MKGVYENDQHLLLELTTDRLAAVLHAFTMLQDRPAAEASREQCVQRGTLIFLQCIYKPWEYIMRIPHSFPSRQESY